MKLANFIIIKTVLGMRMLRVFIVFIITLFMDTSYLLAQSDVTSANNKGQGNLIFLIIVCLFIVFGAYQTKKHEGGTFWGHILKISAWILGIIGTFWFLINLISSGKEKANEITETVFYNTTDDRIEYSSSSVTLTIAYPKIGVSSVYGIEFSDDLIALEEKVFNELRSDSYSGNIIVRVRFLIQDKYGNEQIESPIQLGELDVDDIKKYRDYSAYKPQIGTWIAEYIRKSTQSMNFKHNE